METSGGWENRRGVVGDGEGNVSVPLESEGFHGDS